VVAAGGEKLDGVRHLKHPPRLIRSTTPTNWLVEEVIVTVKAIWTAQILHGDSSGRDPVAPNLVKTGGPGPTGPSGGGGPDWPGAKTEEDHGPGFRLEN